MRTMVYQTPIFEDFAILLYAIHTNHENVDNATVKKIIKLAGNRESTLKENVNSN